MLGVGSAWRPVSLRESAFEFVGDSRRRLETFHWLARGNIEKDKENARRKYDNAHRVGAWVPFRVGDLSALQKSLSG